MSLSPAVRPESPAGEWFELLDGAARARAPEGIAMAKGVLAFAEGMVKNGQLEAGLVEGGRSLLQAALQAAVAIGQHDPGQFVPWMRQDEVRLLDARGWLARAEGASSGRDGLGHEALPIAILAHGGRLTGGESLELGLVFEHRLTRTLAALLAGPEGPAVAEAAKTWRSAAGLPLLCHALTQGGSMDFAWVALLAGCDPNEAAENGRTPLFFARHAGAVKTLLDAGGRFPDPEDARLPHPWDAWAEAGVSRGEIAAMRALAPKGLLEHQSLLDRAMAGMPGALRALGDCTNAGRAGRASARAAFAWWLAIGPAAREGRGEPLVGRKDVVALLNQSGPPFGGPQAPLGEMLRVALAASTYGALLTGKSRAFVMRLVRNGKACTSPGYPVARAVAGEIEKSALYERVLDRQSFNHEEAVSNMALDMAQRIAYTHFGDRRAVLDACEAFAGRQGFDGRVDEARMARLAAHLGVAALVCGVHGNDPGIGAAGVDTVVRGFSDAAVPGILATCRYFMGKEGDGLRRLAPATVLACLRGKCGLGMPLRSKQAVDRGVDPWWEVAFDAEICHASMQCWSEADWASAAVLAQQSAMALADLLQKQGGRGEGFALAVAKVDDCGRLAGMQVARRRLGTGGTPVARRLA